MGVVSSCLIFLSSSCTPIALVPVPSRRKGRKRPRKDGASADSSGDESAGLFYVCSRAPRTSRMYRIVSPWDPRSCFPAHKVSWGMMPAEEVACLFLAYAVVLACTSLWRVLFCFGVCVPLCGMFFSFFPPLPLPLCSSLCLHARAWLFLFTRLPSLHPFFCPRRGRRAGGGRGSGAGGPGWEKADGSRGNPGSSQAAAGVQVQGGVLRGG